MHASVRAFVQDPKNGRAKRVLAAFAVSTLLLGACSNDRFASSSQNDADMTLAATERKDSPATAIGLATGDAAGDTVSVAESAADRSAPATSIPGQTPSALINRKIIRTAQVTLEVANVPDATTKLRNAVTAAGGFLGSEEATYGLSDQVTLTFRIPVGQFDTMINRLSKFGSVLSTNIASEEVTNQYRDLESRLRSKKISAERLRQLITQAVKPSDILLIEHELSDREAEIESMQGQLNVLGDQTSLSTITLTLVSKGNSAVVAPVKTREPSFRRAWRNSVDALGDIAQALAAASGAVLPFVPFLAILLAAALWLKRRSARRRNRTTNAPIAPTDTPIEPTPADDANPLP